MIKKLLFIFLLFCSEFKRFTKNTKDVLNIRECDNYGPGHDALAFFSFVLMCCLYNIEIWLLEFRSQWYYCYIALLENRVPYGNLIRFYTFLGNILIFAFSLYILKNPNIYRIQYFRYLFKLYNCT